MKFLLQSLLFWCVCAECLPFPQCCHRPFHYYSDFSIMFKCGISKCKEGEKASGNTCVSCIPKAPPVNQLLLASSNELAISKPQKLCQSLDVKNGPNSGQMILSWQSRMDFPPSVFLIEARYDLSQEGDWGIVGMTNESFAEITNLELLLEYQFRVTPVISANITLLPVISEWIKISNSSARLTAPSNVSVTKFSMRDGSMEAVVTWAASKELPCVYKIIWLSEVDDYKQQIIKMPDDLSAVLPKLLFERNYTVSVIPNDQNGRRRADFTTTWFVTPDCLNVTGHNFTLCAPGPPLNASVRWTGMMAVVSWLPPEFTSAGNSVTGYHVYLVQNGKTYIDSISVDEDTLNVSFAYLNPTINYSFEVRAVSKSGTGKTAVADVVINEFSAVKHAGSTLPYHYIVPSLAILLIVVAIILCKLHRRTSKHKAHPSGVADVGDHLRPFLVSSDKIQLEEMLGKGEYGVVHKAVYMRSKSNEEVAVKVLPSETSTRLMLLHEVEMMCFVGRHDHIVGFYGFTLDIEKMYLILEYCPLGNLHSYLATLRPMLLRMKSLSISERMSNITEQCKGYGKRLCSYIYQVVQAMEYIASLKLVHMDVAARNVLMITEDKVKISDFGLTKDVYESEFYYGSEMKKLPIKWMAPESIDKQKFTTHSDVWSFGVFMWEVFRLGKEPYPGLSNTRILEYLRMGYRLERPHCTENWYDIMHSCWRNNPKDRPKFKELLKKIGEIIDKMWHYTIIT